MELNLELIDQALDFEQRINRAFTGMVAFVVVGAGGLILSLRSFHAKTIRPTLRRQPTMSRNQLVLALLATASGRAYTPAQLQKSVFLISKNMPQLVTEGAGFYFEPYDYGPFDRDVYVEAQQLKDSGAADISPAPWGRWVMYSATQEGIAKGQEILNSLPEATRKYIGEVSSWALSQSFSSLVKAIYDLYPDMRVNSIFRDPA